MPSIKNQEMITKIKELKNKYSSAILVSHKSLSFKELEKIKKISNDETKIIKFKNTIVKIGLNSKNFNNILKNQNFIIFSNDIFNSSKIAVELSKNKNIEIKQIELNNNSFPQENLKFISKLNSQNELIGSIFSSVINWTSSSLHAMIESLKQQKENNNV